jgi:hypothetical protein
MSKWTVFEPTLVLALHRPLVPRSFHSSDSRSDNTRINHVHGQLRLSQLGTGHPAFECHWRRAPTSADVFDARRRSFTVEYQVQYCNIGRGNAFGSALYTAAATGRVIGNSSLSPRSQWAIYLSNQIVSAVTTCIVLRPLSC